VFDLDRRSLLLGAFPIELRLEAIYPCPDSIDRCACPLELRTASPRCVARPGRSRLRELPVTNIGHPVAFVRDLLALAGDHVTLLGYPVAFICSTRSLFKLSPQALEAGDVGSYCFRSSFAFGHASDVGLCSRPYLPS